MAKRKKKEDTPLTQKERRVLFLAGACGLYLPPARRDAAREFWDGQTLVQQGYIRVNDPLEAKAFIEDLKRR